MRPVLRAPIACVTLVAFLAASLPHRLARADEAASVAQPAAAVASDSTSAPAGKDRVTPSDGNSAMAPSTVIAPAVPQGPLQVQSLPSGADKSGVTSQSISVPQGAGKVQGMGESFSAQLSTGIATYSVPISLPPARGAAQPSLGLSYSKIGPWFQWGWKDEKFV